jgi:hypothetical protein
MKIFVWSLGVFLGLSAQAAMLEFQGTPLKKFDESGLQIPFYGEAILKLAGITPPAGVRLQATGAGLREKKIVFLNVNVYLASHYTDGLAKLPEEPMDAIRKTKYRALQMTMLRDLSAEKIRDAFTDSLKSNAVDTESPGMASLLKQISFDVKKGQTITFAAFPLPNGSQGVLYELAGQSFRAEGPGLADQFWSIWFGKPADGGLERLKKALTSSGS